MGRLYILLSITLGFSIATAYADEPVSLPGADLAGLWQYLEQNSAELEAARLETSAAEQRAAATGALPDPSLRIEWQDVNQPGGETLNPSQVAAPWCVSATVCSNL